MQKPWKRDGNGWQICGNEQPQTLKVIETLGV
jgi:hypothetical protein